MQKNKTSINWYSIKQHLLTGKPIYLYDFPNMENKTQIIFIGSPPANLNFLRSTEEKYLTIYCSSQFINRIKLNPYSNLELSIGLKKNQLKKPSRNQLHTISALYNLILISPTMTDKELIKKFNAQFDTPGQTPVIPAANQLLLETYGHPELALSIAKILHLPEVVIAVESRDQNFSLPLITGKDIVEEFFK